MARKRKQEEEELKNIELRALQQADLKQGSSSLQFDADAINLKIKFSNGSVEKIRVKKASEDLFFFSFLFFFFFFFLF